MKKIIVLGTGLIGKTMAADLCGKYDVTCADIDVLSLEQLSEKLPVRTIACDFNNKDELKTLLYPFDLVLCAVPGFLGFSVLRTIIQSKKNVVDISFFPEDPFELDALAKKNNVTAIVDCGVAPGMCNILAGYHHAQSKLKYYECLVGGLPVEREWPFEYKAVFSPADVIEEYTRPARLKEKGSVVVKEALSETELQNFAGVGTLEAFNTDGLRTLLQTMPEVPDMKEKTLRYPGHVELMRVFRETGFFSQNEIEIKDSKISPREMTSRLLFPKWELKKSQEDITVMKVTLENSTGKYIYSLLDHYDKKNNTTSMARTTAFTATAAANLVLNGKFKKQGVCPPEFIGQDKKCTELILSYLAERNVYYKKTVKRKQKVNT